MKPYRLMTTTLIAISLMLFSMTPMKKQASSQVEEIISFDDTYYCYCWTYDRAKDKAIVISNIVRVVEKGSHNYSTNAADKAKIQFKEALEAAGVDYDSYHSYGSCSESESEAAREKRNEKGEFVSDGYSVREFQFRYYNED